MDTELIKAFGQAAGIGGLALGVFLLIAKELIRKAIFSSLTKQQSSKVILILAFMAWTTALTGIGAWTYISVHPPNGGSQENNNFPATAHDKKTVSEALAFLEIKLTLLNRVYTLFIKALDAADDYIKNPDHNNNYNSLVKTIEYVSREMRGQLEQNHPLADSLRQHLANTPLRSEDLAILYDLVNLDVREMPKRLAFLLMLTDPNMPFDHMTQEKWIETRREIHRQSLLNLSYAVCEFLLPIKHDALLDFRTNALPKLTAFESDAFDFNLDGTQLKQLQSASENKRNSLGDKLATLVGGVNLDAQVLKAYIEEKGYKLQSMTENDKITE